MVIGAMAHFYRECYQMDVKLVAFLVLLGVLVIAQYYTQESFVVRDCSGADCSGSRPDTITISTSTLLALLGRTGPSSSSTRQAQSVGETTTYDPQFKSSLLSDVKKVVADEVGKARTVMIGQELVDAGVCDGASNDGAAAGASGSGVQSWADEQGAAFLTTAPGKNPNDYIRKDSIPCWGCSLK